MKLLIVEDSERLRKSLGEGLRRSGFAVDLAGDGEAGLRFALALDYDVIVLELMLPLLDGLSVLRRLREAGKNASVLILSAKDQVQDRIRGLELGADDYLVKPFAFDELLARLKALVRRGYQRRNPLLQLGAVELNTALHSVSCHGAELTLTPNEMALLATLRLTLIITGLIVISLIIVLVRLAVAGSLQPLTDIRHQMTRLDAGSLDMRLDPPRRVEELDDMVDQFNAMIGRLQAAFEHERRFSADVAHELRTPLAELRNLAEVGGRWPDAPLLVRDFFSEILAATRQIERIVINLFSNAATYSPAGTTVSCRIEQQGEALRLSIANRAEHLEAADLPHLFERMWRKDPARTGGHHAGLGLSLVKAYAEQLKLAVDVALEPDRVFRITLSAH